MRLAQGFSISMLVFALRTEYADSYSTLISSGFAMNAAIQYMPGCGGLSTCMQNELLGRRCYNSAIFIIFGGLFFAIAPYNIVIAFIVAGLGILLELWQMDKLKLITSTF